MALNNESEHIINPDTEPVEAKAEEIKAEAEELKEEAKAETEEIKAEAEEIKAEAEEIKEKAEELKEEAKEEIKAEAEEIKAEAEEIKEEAKAEAEEVKASVEDEAAAKAKAEDERLRARAKAKGLKMEDLEKSAEETEQDGSKKKRKLSDGMDLQDFFWIGVIVAAVIAFIFVLISQSAINGPGYYQFQAFGMKQPIKFEWLTSSLAGWIAGGFGVVSLGCGIGRNILKKKNKSTINILPGIVMVVLAVICLLAIRFAK